MTAALSGGITAAILYLIGAIVTRKKTKAETRNIEATAADTITQAAARLATGQDKRIADLERRLTLAELKAATAEANATLAREAEHRCSAELVEVKRQIDDLRHTIATALPTKTTTVTSTVTKETPA